MGKHTEYWQRYSRDQVRGARRMFAAIVAWIIVITCLTLAQDALAGAFPWLMGAAFAGLAATLLVLARNVYNVTCPECGTSYTRSKWGGQCPRCGLKLLQPDP